MLSDNYLERGLGAMARAAERDAFADGHRGAALLAACFFSREAPIEPGVSDLLAAILDDLWARSELCAPLPRDEPEPGGVERLVRHLLGRPNGVQQATHHVILPTLALKALASRPECATTACVDGLCRLVDALTSPSPSPAPALATPAPEPAAAQLVLREFLASLRRFAGRGQGWTGHLLTLARAVRDLHQLGHVELATYGEATFAAFLERVRQGPLEVDVARAEHAPSPLRPHHLAYWQRRRGGSFDLGHAFKYPYAFYGLLADCDDEALAAHCLSAAYRIF